MKLQKIPVAALTPHPDNPRGPITPEDVAELAASIKTNGLLCPLVVTVHTKREDRWTVVAGHRRLAALKSLGETEVECTVLELDETDAFSIMLADNVHRKDLDPLRAGALVEQFLAKHKDATVEQVAERLGKPVRWVAQARALGTLSPAWRKRRDNPKDVVATLPVAKLVAIASLAPERQDVLAKELRDSWAFDSHRFDAVIASETRRLSAAPWALDDAQLVKKAGPCSTCPKTSLGTPGLFDGAGDPGDVKSAVCRDGACFVGKLAAHSVRAIEKAKGEHPGLLVLDSAPGGDGSGAREQSLVEALQRAGIEVEGHYSYTRKRGGKPAYVLSGKGAGTVVEVARYGERESSGGGSRAKAKSSNASGPSASERRVVYRLRHVFKACEEAVRAMKDAPKVGVVLGLIRAYGYAEGRGEDLAHRKRVVADAVGESYPAFAAACWPELRETCAGRFTASTFREVEELGAELRWLAELLGLDLKAFEAAALAEIPEPGKRSAKPKAKAPAKPRAKRKAVAAAK